MMPENALLTVNDLCITASGKHSGANLVEGVNFCLEPGQILGITGRSGSGKTLTALALAGILPPPLKVRKGKVRFMGDPVVPEKGARKALISGRDVMMLFQSPSRALDPWIKIGVHITDAIAAVAGKNGGKEAGGQVHNGNFKSAAIQSLEKAGLNVEAFDRYPFELSGGQRQRALMALALAVRPRILIADEPVTGQDDINKGLVTKGLRDLTENGGTAVIIISHDLRGLQGLARELVVIYNGRQVEAGPARDIIDNPYHVHTRELVSAMKFMEGAGL